MTVEVCYYPEFPSENTEEKVKPIKEILPNCKAVSISPYSQFVEFLDVSGHTIMGIRKKLVVYYKAVKKEDN